MDTQKLPIDASAVVDRMKEALGITRDTALCAAFRLGVSTVSTWRRRNSVPYAECVDIALRRGVSLDWLILGLDTHSAGAGTQNAEVPAAGIDPRITRMAGFLHAWQAGHDADDVAWLERTLARAVPEYAEWLAANP